MLAGAAIFLIGFRGGLDRYDSNVIDVGYAGVVGADRLVSGDTPYGTFPTNTGRPAASRTPTGRRRATARSTAATAARARSSSATRTAPSTTPPTCRAVALLGWTGLWDDLPAAHFTSALFDALCALGLLFVGQTAGRLAARRGARVRVGGLPVHRVRARVELERHDRDGVRDLGLRVGDLAGRARLAARARVVVEVRAARALAAVAALPARPAARARRVGVRRGSRSRSRAGAAAARLRDALWLGPRRTTLLAIGGLALGTLPAALLLMPGGTRRAARVLGRDLRLPALAPVAVLALALGHLPGPARPADRAGGAPGRASRSRPSPACGCRGGSTPCASPRSRARS